MSSLRTQRFLRKNIDLAATMSTRKNTITMITMNMTTEATDGNDSVLSSCKLLSVSMWSGQFLQVYVARSWGASSVMCNRTYLTVWGLSASCVSRFRIPVLIHIKFQTLRWFGVRVFVVAMCNCREYCMLFPNKCLVGELASPWLSS